MLEGEKKSNLLWSSFHRRSLGKSTFDLFPDENAFVAAINRHFTSVWQDVFPATLVTQFKYIALTATFSSLSASFLPVTLSFSSLRAKLYFWLLLADGSRLIGYHQDEN